MFEVGFTEIILIFGIALLVLGPARLPKLAADLGRWAGRARAMARQLRTQLEQEVQFDPLAANTAAPKTGPAPADGPVPPAPPPTVYPVPPIDAQSSLPAATEALEPPAEAAVTEPVPRPDTTVPDERKPG